MAGLGWKTWSTGDTVTAANFQGYLQDQVVQVWASTSARDTGNPTPSEGQFAFTTDTDTLYYYDGSSWTSTSLTADITAVTTAAASGLSGGGNSGDIALVLNLAGVTAAQAFGADGAGVDVVLHSTTSGDNATYDASAARWIIEGTNSTTALDVSDGNVVIGDGTLSVSGAITATGGVTGNVTGTAATVTGAAQSAITSVGTLTSLDVTGAVTAGSLVAPLAINAQTGTTYTFVLADAGKLVTSSNGSAQTVTVPPNSSVAFDVGTQIIVQNIGSANATLAEGSGVTINSKDSNKEIDGQYAAATLIKTATDAWSLIGALA